MRGWLRRGLCVGGIGFGSIAGAQGDPLALAEEAYQKGHYQQAFDLARKGLDRSPAKGWRIAGASSCQLKDRAGALEALGHLRTPADAELIRFACQRAGVEISDEDAALYASPAHAQVDAAQAAYSAGRYADAKKLALAATTADPKLAKAWRLLGAAACWTRDKRTAQLACDHLQPVDQEFIRATCGRTLGHSLRSSRVVR
jgi:tetratricopeptide (TPR) repeat protein